MTKDRKPTENRAKGQASGLTTAALRQAIDHGRGGDKVNFTDPAAAPLGTDDEAAGTPPTQDQIRLAAAAELGPLRPKAGPKGPRTPADRAGPRLPGSMATWLVVPAAALGVAIVVMALLWLGGG